MLKKLHKFGGRISARPRGFVRTNQCGFLQLLQHAPDMERLNRRRPMAPGFSREIASLRDAFGVRDRCSGRQ
ncbi:hypothetical protein V2I55_07875 [Brenneria sp. HEZEL_4_2_4]|nr:hypothetical protein [Brenneria sp. HEZEL_4_2_4]NPD00665.1 hypothetical protein [Brenneria sp. hezel4-2-4]